MATCSGCGRRVDDGFMSCPVCGGTAIPGRAERGLQPLFEVGRVVASRFRIDKVLGSGASGVVYGVADVLRKDRAALKVLWDQAGDHDPSMERLRREIRASQKAPHPNLVAVHDLLVVEGRPALLMEWVEGETLRERVRREGPLEWSEAVRVAEGLLSALSHLHEMGIAHRDVKSGNVLLGPEGAVKLGDFGLAKGEDLGMSLTVTGVSLGTPGYMAPEVIRGAEATGASDLYSAGAVLYEMLAGRLPFQGASSLEVASRQLHEPPPLGPLRERKAPRWLVRFTARLLEPASSDRFPSAKAALRALRERRGLWLTRRLRRGLAGAALFCTGAAALAWGARWWSAHALPALTSEGATLTAKDALGRTLFTRTFRSPIQSACAGRFLPGGKPGVAVALAWDESEPRPVGDSGANWGNRVLVLDRRGREAASRRVALQGHPFAPRYQVELSPHRFAPEEPDRLVAYVRHTMWYPAGLLVFPPVPANQSGAGTDSFVPTQFTSSGHLVFPFIYRDVDGDGTQDVVFTAVNNVLYKVYAAGVLFVPPAGSRVANDEASPDLHFADNGLGGWYRLLSFHYKMPQVSWTEAPPGFLFECMGKPFLRLDGRWACADPSVAALSDLAGLNAWIGEISRLRAAGEWRQMLGRLSGDARALPSPYGWLKRLFTANALMGLSRYGEALAELDGGPPLEDGMKPYAAYHLRLNALFLAGRYRECVAAFMDLPEAVQKDWADMGITAFWAANYLGDDPLTRSFISGSQVNRYPMPEAASLLSALRGDFVRGQVLAEDQKPGESPEPEPALVLVHCLLMEGKTAEARRVMDEVARRFPGERMDEGETQLWLLWHEKPGNPALLRSMDGLVNVKRRLAASDVGVRALLPLTLARAARMHRDAGDRSGADRLLNEALRLAPTSWRPGLEMDRR